MIVTDLDKNEYDEYTSYYIGLVPNGDFHEEFEKSKQLVLSIFKSLPESKWEYSYEKGKWTLKQLLQHLIDTERIFAYRALRFARLDDTTLPGFEVDDYNIVSGADRRTGVDLLIEFESVRVSTQLLFKSFDNSMLESRGEASSSIISVRAAGFKLIGHDIHHIAVVNEKYL